MGSGTASVEARLLALIDKVKKQGGGACMSAVEEAIRDPETRQALLKLGKDILTDVGMVRTPGLGAYTLTHEIAQRAYNRSNAGDLLGAVSDYGAVTAIGALSWLPVASDGAIEFLRSQGVDLKMSPLRNAYNTVSGAWLVCQAMDAQARLSRSGGKSEKDSQWLKEHSLTQEQADALMHMASRMEKAQEEAKIDMQAQKTDTPKHGLPPSAISQSRSPVNTPHR